MSKHLAKVAIFYDLYFDDEALELEEDESLSDFSEDELVGKRREYAEINFDLGHQMDMEIEIEPA